MLNEPFNLSSLLVHHKISAYFTDELSRSDSMNLKPSDQKWKGAGDISKFTEDRKGDVVHENKRICCSALKIASFCYVPRVWSSIKEKLL